MNYITYEQFGAVGDGVTDDMPAIIRAHDEANRTGLSVKAREGAKYYIAPIGVSAYVMTDTDWNGAEFIIDDRGLDRITPNIFCIVGDEECKDFSLEKAEEGQSSAENPTGRELFVTIVNDTHRDFIRYGGNQDNGSPRRDCFIVRPDGTLASAICKTFDRVTGCAAKYSDTKPIKVCGGDFTTIANQCESKYTYHGRGIGISRCNTAVCGIHHRITGELDHGAPYGGFFSVSNCAHIEISDCILTGHFIYYTMGTGGVTVPMGSYEINCNCACDLKILRCTQYNDINDRNYWGVYGSNVTRDVLFEDCVLSRYDSHTGVTNCTIRGCTLGWQCLNAIGFGELVVENTTACGAALVNLRGDYGCTWKGNVTIRNCVWRPSSAARGIISCYNDGKHDFGYQCYMPIRVEIDGLRAEGIGADEKLYVFAGRWNCKKSDEVPYPMRAVEYISVKNTSNEVGVCPDEAMLEGITISE